MKTAVIKLNGTHTVQMQQGCQFFTLDYGGRKKEAEWMKSMVDKAIENFKEEILSEQRRKIEELRDKYDNQYKNGREILDFEGVSMSTDKYDSYKSQLQIIHEIKKDLNQILKEE